jgi:hypothetical protein
MDLRVGVITNVKNNGMRGTRGFLDRFRPLEENSPMSCVLVLLIAIDVAVVLVGLVLTSPLGVPLPLL